ncbi:tyrosine-type recombinase/integrase [Polyangium jinanense]|uniref:tyrosine-type recombinase/integrase n=1 Tax=Polyangium jinanense TaxID=2829994 RepID=UPI0035598621
MSGGGRGGSTGSCRRSRGCGGRWGLGGGRCIVCRHYAITMWLRVGVPVHVVQRMAGHKHLATTQRYVHHLKEDLEEAGRRLAVSPRAATSCSTPADVAGRGRRVPGTARFVASDQYSEQSSALVAPPSARTMRHAVRLALSLSRDLMRQRDPLSAQRRHDRPT